MKTIHKYTITPVSGNRQTVEMPVGANIVHVAGQGAMIAIWAEVVPKNQNQKKEKRVFEPIWTGMPVPSFANYWGTAFIEDYVYHVYEISL
jgi:hypothetical protein